MVLNIALTCILKTLQLTNHNFRFSTQKSAAYCHSCLLVNLLTQLSFLIISLYVYMYMYIYIYIYRRIYKTNRRMYCVSSAVIVITIKQKYKHNLHLLAIGGSHSCQ
jgi:hypothetical protein